MKIVHLPGEIHSLKIVDLPGEIHSLKIADLPGEIYLLKQMAVQNHIDIYSSSWAGLCLDIKSIASLGVAFMKWRYDSAFIA